MEICRLKAILAHQDDDTEPLLRKRVKAEEKMVDYTISLLFGLC